MFQSDNFHYITKLQMVIPTTSKVFATVCTSQPSSYYSYEDFEITVGNIDDYKISDRLGRGRYSEVFRGIISATRAPVAIKVLKPVREKKIQREILVLRNLNHPNIVKMVDVVKDTDSQTFAIIFEYIQHKETRTLFTELNRTEFIGIMRRVLAGIAYAHSRGIVHRDIKPQNIIVSADKKECKIIDWGLAEFYIPHTEYNVKVASRFYKAPELLVDYTYYDFSLDMWSFGCILAEYFTKKTPFFCGKDNFDQLFVISDVLGKYDFQSYIRKYQISPPDGVYVSKNPKRKSIIIDNDKDLVHIVDNLLLYDHAERLTAQQCQENPFFK